ncbi:hypothetical protein Tco_0819846 [Tanacetum coccineum]|uniref:Reverse transcriptase domain-containing protein n=1 Tax=Tanacetum coccineum TaxID=301880 RepID=A0ABQ5AAR9_9ASTR
MTLYARAEAAEQWDMIREDSLMIFRDRTFETMPTTKQGISFDAIEQLISQCVADAMMAYEANRSIGNGSHNEISGGAGGAMHTSRGWNSHVKTIGIDAAYEMSWKELMKMMTEVYCLRNEIQKMETELWNLTVKGMVPTAEKKIKSYIWGLTENIKGNVTSSEPTRFQFAIIMAHSLMDQVVRASSARQAENKRR